MSSPRAASTSISDASNPLTYYVECYDVMYRAGDAFKNGKKAWHDGLLSYTTLNHRLVLRDDCGFLIGETFKDPSTAGIGPPPAIKKEKEDGLHTQSFPCDVPFAFSEAFTVEIMKVDSINRETAYVTPQCQATRQETKKKQIDAIFQQHEDVLPAVLKRSVSHATETSARAEAAAAVASGTKKMPESVVTPVPFAYDRQRCQTSPCLNLKKIPISPAARCRAVGLSRTPSRPTVGPTRETKRRKT